MTGASLVLTQVALGKDFVFWLRRWILFVASKPQKDRLKAVFLLDNLNLVVLPVIKKVKPFLYILLLYFRASIIPAATFAGTIS